jgi:hypothetical protein
MPQRNDDQNRGGPGGRQNRDDMQRSPGTDQGGGRGVQTPQRGGGQGQRMDRPDSGDSDGGTGRTGRRDDSE